MLAAVAAPVKLTLLLEELEEVLLEAMVVETTLEVMAALKHQAVQVMVLVITGLK